MQLPPHLLCLAYSNDFSYTFGMPYFPVLVINNTRLSCHPFSSHSAVTMESFPLELHPGHSLRLALFVNVRAKVNEKLETFDRETENGRLFFYFSYCTAKNDLFDALAAHSSLELLHSL